MAESVLYTGLPLEVRHVPDYSTETGDEGVKVQVQLPGFLEFGVTLDGAWVPLLSQKAAGTFEKIARAKKAAAAAAAAEPPPAPAQ